METSPNFVIKDRFIEVSTFIDLIKHIKVKTQQLVLPSCISLDNY